MPITKPSLQATSLSAQEESPLPDTILLFDGVCNLCSRSVQFVLSHDKQNLFHFASLQSPIGQKLLQQYRLNEQPLTSLVLIHKRQAFIRSTAALNIAKLLEGPWLFMNVFRFIPTFIRDGVYNWIANHRYQWFGKHNTCWLPTPTLRARFLDGQM